MRNWIDVEVTNEEVLIHATARLMKDGNYYIDARVGGDVLLGGKKFTIDQVVEVKLIREDNQAVEHRVQSDEFCGVCQQIHPVNSKCRERNIFA